MLVLLLIWSSKMNYPLNVNNTRPLAPITSHNAYQINRIWLITKYNALSLITETRRSNQRFAIELMKPQLQNQILYHGYHILISLFNNANLYFYTTHPSG